MSVPKINGSVCGAASGGVGNSRADVTGLGKMDPCALVAVSAWLRGRQVMTQT